jgi:NADH-ubiquinone oxidoreductase chain 5
MYLAIIILPLFGSIASGFLGRKFGVAGAQVITCIAVVLTTLLAVLAFFEVGYDNTPMSMEVFR